MDNRPRYTPTTTFEPPPPFAQGPSIAALAGVDYRDGFGDPVGSPQPLMPPDYDEPDLVELLASIPCTKEVAQGYLQRGHDIRLPRTSWHMMWDRLVERLGEESAIDAVSELVLATAHPRVADLVAEYEEHGEVRLRATEPKMAVLLFDDDGFPTELGVRVFAYRSRKGTMPARRSSKSRAPRTREPSSTRDVASPSSPTPAHLRLQEVKDAVGGPWSAASGTGWRLERVRASRDTFLAAQPGWIEADLENFIISNWENIDFGLEKRLGLVGRQVRLKDTREKVDLLARDEDNTWVAIELKIKSATGNDLTQLLSYMQDLAFSGRRPEQIRGILIAPNFGEKVLNAATLDSRVVLLRFLSER